MGNLNEIMGGAFDASQYEDDQRDDSPLPAGEYTVEVERAEIKSTKNGAGKGVNVQFSVLGDDHGNRKIFNWFNIAHTNQQAADIGQRQLATMVKATGLAAINDTEELLGKVLNVRIKIKDGRNEVTSYKPAEAVSAPAAAPGKPAAAPAAKPSAPVMPWQR